MRTQRAGHVGEARLAQRGIVEQALDKDHLGAVLDLLPSIQAALGPRQEAVSEGGADAAAVEVDDVPIPKQGKDDALIESICALGINEAGCSQLFELITVGCQMAA